jgi:RND family efflux transporter MFP subunit
MLQRFTFLTGFGLVAGICTMLTGCAHQQGPAPQGPPPTVTVSYPLERRITDYAEYPGRTAAVDTVQVMARVTGYLDKVNFKDGSEVKKGDVLYEIDPRPYEATLKQAEGQVTQYEAQLKFHEAEYTRNQRLYNAGQVESLETVQSSLSARNTAQGQLTSARATVEQAKLNLEWTKVRAPISGLLSRTLVTPGNLILASQTLLTTLVSQDPIYAYFDADEPTVLRVQQLIREGKFKSAREKGVHVPVYLGLSSEEGYPHEGALDFVNNQVSPSTGTLQLRGLFSNPKPPVGPRLLSPGLFVRIRVPTSPPYQALLVNQAAIGMDQNVKYLYVLDDNDHIVRHDVTLGTQQGPLQVITEGLKAGERVVVSGLQHVRPGITVTPRQVPMPTTTHTASPQPQAPGTQPGKDAPQPAPSMKQNPPPASHSRS